MTPKLEYLKQEIENKIQEMSKIQNQLLDLKRQCTHYFEKITPQQFADFFMSVDAKCVVCGVSFGWRCKESPDGVCHYFVDDHPSLDKPAIKLLDGKWDLNFPQENWSKEYETSDECIYCRHPEERK